MSEYDSLPAPLAGQEYANALILPLVCGWVLEIYLLGAFTNAFVSYQQAPKLRPDSKTVKAALWSVLLLLYLDLGFNLEELFRYSAYQNRDAISLVTGGFVFGMQPIVAGLVATLVQIFLMLRASKLFLSRRLKVVFFVVMGLLITTSLAGALLTAALGYVTFTSQALPIMSYGAAVAIWLWASATADIALSIALYVNLRSRIAGFNMKTDHAIQSLINVALKTASYTAVVALAGAITSVGIPFDSFLLTNVPCAFYLPLPTLYAFSIFTTITSRDLISRKQSKSSGPLSFMNPLPQYGSGLHSGVRVEREVEVELSERPEVNPWKEQDQEKVSPEVSQV